MVSMGMRLLRSLERFFLLDMIRDQKSRYIFLWTFGILVIGTLVFRRLEGWSTIDSLYFSVVTLSTVGYGDLSPTHPVSKLVTVFYILNGIGVLLALFDRLQALRDRRQRLEDSQVDRLYDTEES